ncbi:MAG: GtrA family protein [Bacteroidaceae bacterium]|nr:GtrA family protein [Bacteroidaceae bacterium]MBQ6693279.1 GtrA family protein [Bacteroidaceae bacterium]MBR7166364.1 GtrA family protein [Bacteroidaceae bacterium]
MKIARTDNTWLQIFRYCFVAVAAFVVDYGCYALVLWLCGLEYYLWANVAGFIFGTLTNYAVAKCIVFQGIPKSRVLEVVLVFIIGATGLLFQQVGLYLLTGSVGLHPMLSKLVVTAVCFFWNFFARKFLMYSGRFNIIKD